MFSWDFFLLHPLCWQLLEELRGNKGEKNKHKVFTFVVRIAVENSDNVPLSHTNLHAGLLGGSRRDLGMVVGLRGLHRESHYRGCDGGRWGVVVRDLGSHNRKTHPKQIG